MADDGNSITRMWIKMMMMIQMCFDMRSDGRRRSEYPAVCSLFNPFSMHTGGYYVAFIKLCV